MSMNNIASMAEVAKDYFVENAETSHEYVLTDGEHCKFVRWGTYPNNPHDVVFEVIKTDVDVVARVHDPYNCIKKL